MMWGIFFDQVIIQPLCADSEIPSFLLGPVTTQVSDVPTDKGGSTPSATPEEMRGFMRCAAGAKVDDVDFYTYDRALHWAIRQHQIAMLKNAHDPKGYLARRDELLFGCKAGNKNIIDLSASLARASASDHVIRAICAFDFV